MLQRAIHRSDDEAAFRSDATKVDGAADVNSALSKAIHILEALTDSAQSLGIPDLCERLKLPRQTAHRVIRHLEELGLIRRDMGRERYLTGPRLARLGGKALHQSHLWGPGRAVLGNLVAKVQETCNLGMLDGDNVVYIDRVECNWPLRLRLDIGSRVPLHCTAIGKILLAYMPAAERDRFLDALALPRFTRNTLATRAKLQTALAQIARQGYSTNNAEDMPGLIAVGVPIVNMQGRVVAGLALHAPVGRLSLRQAIKWVPALKAAASRLRKIGRTEALGF